MRLTRYYATVDRRVLKLSLVLAVGMLVLILASLVIASREGRAAVSPATAGQASADGLLKIDADDLARSGVRTAPLAPAQGASVAQAFATVVDVAPLADLRNSAAAAQAQVTALRAKAATSRAASERTATLYKDDQNMSLAQAQAAEATSHADTAAATAAGVQLQTVRTNARQQFGPVLAQLTSPSVEALVSGRLVLLQVTAPAGATYAPPARLAVEGGDGRQVEARFLSSAVRVDPRIQGPGYYYLAPANPGLQAGMNVTIRWPAGPPAAGVLVPGSAAVAWQGQWWAYQMVAAGAFRRVPIDTRQPMPGGYLVRTLPVGAKVVTDGAQLLLSQELKPKSQGADGDDG